MTTIPTNKTTVLEMNSFNGGYDNDIINGRGGDDDDDLTNSNMSKSSMTWSGRGFFKFFNAQQQSRRQIISSMKQKKDIQKWQRQPAMQRTDRNNNNSQLPQPQDTVSAQQQNQLFFQSPVKNVDKVTCVKIINPLELYDLNAFSLRGVNMLEIEDSEAVLTGLPGNLLLVLEAAKLSHFSMRWSAIKHVPAELFHSGLVSLILTDNHIKKITGLERAERSLRLLNLQSNQLISLPRELCYMINLVELNVSRNNLTELIDTIGSLRNLEILDCSFNKLKTLPESMSELVNLKRLNISSNMIISLESSFSQLIKLEDLQASHNQLSSLPFSFDSTLVNLKSVLLGKNSFRNIPTCLCNLPKLENLNLKQNSLQFVSSSLTYVTTLVLDDNNLSEIPLILLQSRAMENLWLRNNQLEGIPQEISSLTLLRTLHLDGNTSLRHIPPSMASMKNLKRLSIKNTLVDSANAVIISLLKGNVTVEFGSNDNADRLASSRHTLVGGTGLKHNARETLSPFKNDPENADSPTVHQNGSEKFFKHKQTRSASHI